MNPKDTFYVQYLRLRIVKTKSPLGISILTLFGPIWFLTQQLMEPRFLTPTLLVVTTRSSSPVSTKLMVKTGTPPIQSYTFSSLS